MLIHMQAEHDTQARILRALRFRPKGMTITDMAKQIGATRNAVSKHLEILQIAGRVDVRAIGNAKVYSLAQRVPMSAFLCFTKNLILILDGQQRIVQANDQCLRHLRRTKDELIGLTIEEAALPVVSTAEALAVIENLEKEQVIADIPDRRGDDERFYQMQAIPTTFEDGEKGCTIVLEEITERKRYVRNMEFLARTAMELVDMPAEEDIYEYIAERIHEIVPGGCLYVGSYDEVKQQFAIRAIRGEGFREGLIQLLGLDPVGLVFPYGQMLAEFHTTRPGGGDPANLLHGGIDEIAVYPEPGPEGLSFYDLCFRQIPEEICDRILCTFSIGTACITFLVWEDRLFGIVGIFLSPGEVLKDRQAVESFLRQASLAIARRQTEDRLRRSERRFRDVVDLAPSPAAIVDPDGNYTFLNRRFTETFGYTLADIPTGRDWFERAYPDPDYRRAAIAAWQEDRERIGRGQPRPRTFSVRCKNGEEKAILFRPVELCDGTQYITYEDVTEDRRAYDILIGEIAGLRRK
ncbi:MAG: PAS domain-containing protein [Methanomicrobiaceae archaeon]|nr:PAS domain-containing protein [Methanomicrobiaceae archaeon]